MNRAGNLFFRCGLALIVSVMVSPCIAIGQEAEDNDHERAEAAEAMERWAEENRAQMEKWAEEHAQRWEDWASRFEGEWEKWAEEQEGVWNEWAEQYAQRWEEWGQEMEHGEMNADEIRSLMDHNLEMLEKIPLQQMIEKAMKAGGRNLDSAPWDSLEELRDLAGDAVERSLAEMEQLQEEQQLHQEEGESDKRVDSLRRIEKMQEAIRRLQSGLDRPRTDDTHDHESPSDEAQEAERQGHYKRALEKYRAAAEAGDEQARQAVQAWLEAIEKSRAGKATDDNRARRDAERIRQELDQALRSSREQEGHKVEEARGIRDRSSAQRDRATAEALKLEKELAQRAESGEADGVVRQFYRQLEAEREKLKAREDELAALRAKIEELTRTVQELKRERDQ